MYKILFILSVLLILSASCRVKINDDAEEVQSETVKDTSITKVVMLGSGNPNADPKCSGPCVAVVVHDTPYIVDCGPGLVRRASAAHGKGITALKVDNIERLFVTHLHSDHTVGYPDLIFTPWVLGRKVPLEVYGPPGIEKMTYHILKAYEEDINIRLSGLEPASTEGYKVNSHEFVAGEIYKDSNVTVTAFPVHHGAWEHAFGFKFETPDKVIVISGDCVTDSTVIEHSMACDILVHEIYSKAGFDVRPQVWRTYHADSHTSTHELGKMAAIAKPKLLVLYHVLQWGASDEQFLGEIKEFYDGEVVIGKDLEVY